MARKKSAEAEVCEAAIEGLKDVIRDLDVIAKGRGTDARFWAVYDALWRIQKAVDDINPETIRRRNVARAEEAAKPKPVALIGQQPLFALEDHS